MTICRNDTDFRFITTADGGYVYKKSDRSLQCLNHTAAAIIAFCDRPRTNDEIVEYLSSLYPDAERPQITSDVSSFVKTLVDAQMLLNISVNK